MTNRDAQPRNLYLSGWRTGLAAWIYMTAVERILVLRAEYDGLRVDPLLPAGWKRLRASRVYRGTRYKITYTGSGREGARPESITVDGKVLDDTLIPHNAEKTEVTVRVKLG